MLPVSLRSILRNLGFVDRQRLCLLLAMLYALANLLPVLHPLLPGDPLSIAGGTVPAGRPADEPYMWFPLAYALSGLPGEPARPAPSPATRLHQREGFAPLLLRVVPAMPVWAERWLYRPAYAQRLPAIPGLRPGVADLSLPDPPPRPPQVVACALSPA